MALTSRSFPRICVSGQVGQVRRHGRRLLFVSLAGEQRQIAFIQSHFDAGENSRTVDDATDDYLPFPTSKADIKVGDEVMVLARDVEERLTAWRWRRLSRAAGGPAAQTTQRHLTGRRSGVAASQGWVVCPLCPPSSWKRFNRGAGLEAHLNALHSDTLQG